MTANLKNRDFRHSQNPNVLLHLTSYKYLKILCFEDSIAKADDKSFKTHTQVKQPEQILFYSTLASFAMFLSTGHTSHYPDSRDLRASTAKH